MFSRRSQHIPVLDVVSEEGLLDSDFPFYGREEEGSSLCSSSNLSNDSLCSSESPGDLEAESSFSGGPLESMNSLEDSLPIKKGLSRFFNGKSRSFSSLAEVKSIKDIPKPENPYAKRRNRCVTTLLGGIPDRSRLYPPKSSAGISKKPTHNSNSTKATLALALAMGETGGLENGGEASSSLATLSSSNKWLSCSAPSRSFSLSDLQRVGGHFSSPGKA